ncbi:MAG: 30S ribosomal protein S12 methylthiotransferase RimO [Clostridiaceae bacterium]
MNKLKFGVISLGCDKNRIDSEIFINKLLKNNTLTNNPKEADIIIVNTCGFIEDSKQESIDTILEMANFKEGNCKALVVTGCLSQRYGKELQNLLPEIDIMVGVNDYDKLDQYINNYLEKNHKETSCNYSDDAINEGDRTLSTPGHYAYLRIAEGCSNHCTYCIIPKIRGKYRSRKMEAIIDEARILVQNGTKEIILVAQDTTRYGIDLYGKKMLSDLINELSKLNELKWIRVLYCYPEEIEEDLIKTIAENDKVCKYLDIPIQHISNNILKTMGRRGRKEDILNTISSLKNRVDNICLRTSLIVGFPGETTEDFEELIELVKDVKFNNLGVFKYSQEEDTPAASMVNQIPEEIKESRRNEIMAIQKEISMNLNNSKIGKMFDVVVDGFDGEYYIGRNYEMTPQIDGAIYFKCDKIFNIGEIAHVKIIDSLEYDLVGVVCHESCK